MKRTSMKQIVESGSLKRYIDPRIIVALGHPFREHVLAECNAGIVSATQIGEGIGADVPVFYKQIQKLEELGCIERVDSQPRRGGMEHFFRAKSTLFFDNESVKRVPRTVHDHLLLNQLWSAFDEAKKSAGAGKLGSLAGEHASWIPGRFDHQGWSEAAQILDEALVSIEAILQKSAERLAERNERGTPATVAMFGFKAAQEA
jgi:predicted transcriptional regulator